MSKSLLEVQWSLSIGLDWIKFEYSRKDKRNKKPIKGFKNLGQHIEDMSAKRITIWIQINNL